MEAQIAKTGELSNKQNLFFKGVLLLALALALSFNPAHAQTLKQTGISIFNALYAIVGVCGAIAVLVAGLNWALGNFLGVHDPKKLFFQVLAGTAIAFAAVAIVQFIKEAVGGSGSIGSL
jgi:hypothetical protein